MNARIFALVLALAAAPLAASAQAVTAVPPAPIAPGPHVTLSAPPGNAYLLHDAFPAVTQAQSALYDVARARYNAGDRFGAAREAQLARGAAELPATVTIPVLQSTIGQSQNVVPRSVRPGLRSLDVTGEPLPNAPSSPTGTAATTKAGKASMRTICDALPKGPIEAECRSAVTPP